MTQFLADIAGMLEIFAIAGGLVLLHVASRQERARLLKAAGFILVLGGTGVGVCTSYYWFRYQADGLFSSGHAPHHTMMQSGRGLELH